MSEDHTTYSFEYERRLRACFIGAGRHSFRNVYPTLQYAPVDLQAVCDLDADRASAYARQFGAPRSYTDHREMLERERPEVVFVVTHYRSDGRPQATDLIIDALHAGAHVWSEKPSASTISDITRIETASAETGRHVVTGIKKVFRPSMEKVKEIISSADFGTVASMSLRYGPLSLPPPEERSDLAATRLALDAMFHPGAIVNELMGPVTRFSHEWDPATGGSVAALRFASGAVGALHLVARASGSSPLEHLEVVGDGANVVVDNAIRVTYYRPAAMLAYGRSATYLVPDDVAPLFWEPEFSYGQLHNKNIFYSGYVGEVLHLCEAALTDEPPTRGTLADVRAIITLFDAYRNTPPGESISLPEPRMA